MATQWAGHEIPRPVWEAMKRAGNVYPSVPHALAAAIAYVESGFANRQSDLSTPGYNAPNGRESSYSPWQLLNMGGLGDGYTPDELANLDTAAAIVYEYLYDHSYDGQDWFNAIMPWSTRHAAYNLYINNPLITETPYPDDEPAYPIIGAIRKAWDMLSLGEPLDAEGYSGRTAVQDFQRGTIIWTAIDGRIHVINAEVPGD